MTSSDTRKTAERLAMLMLFASAIVASYLVMIIGHIYPVFVARLYVVKDLSNLDYILPAISLWAARSSWVFALALVLVGLAASLWLRLSSSHPFRGLAIGLSGQGLIVWLAMFCFCYKAFLGHWSIHHEPRFVLEEFRQFGFAIFPTTLSAILLPGFYALFFLKPSASDATHPA